MQKTTRSPGSQVAWNGAIPAGTASDSKCFTTMSEQVLWSPGKCSADDANASDAAAYSKHKAQQTLLRSLTWLFCLPKRPSSGSCRPQSPATPSTYWRVDTYGNQSPVPKFFLTTLYPPCLSQNHRIVGVGRDLCGSSSPSSLSIYMSLSFSLGHCRLACVGNSLAPGWRRNPPPGIRTHQLGTRRLLRDTTVCRLQRSSSLWSGGERSQRKAEAGTGIPSPTPQKLFDCCLHFPLKTTWSSQPPSISLLPNLASFPGVSEAFWAEHITPSACFLFPPPFSSLHRFSHPDGENPFQKHPQHAK